jgi:hypothetical protein
MYVCFLQFIITDLKYNRYYNSKLIQEMIMYSKTSIVHVATLFKFIMKIEKTQSLKNTKTATSESWWRSTE